jgi:cation transport ATPase
MRRRWLTAVLIIPMLFIFYSGYAEFKEVSVGVNGLTCSQCSRSVEMRIRKLSFVSDVKMNLEHTEGHIFFRKGEKIEVDKIAAAVEDAGFSVRFLKAVFDFGNSSVSTDKCYNFSGDSYTFINPSQSVLKGSVSLTFLGTKFQEKREMKKWKGKLKKQCTARGNVYFVSL